MMDEVNIHSFHLGFQQWNLKVAKTNRAFLVRWRLCCQNNLVSTHEPLVRI